MFRTVRKAVLRTPESLTGILIRCYYRRFSGLREHMETFQVDAFEFCRTQDQRSGETAVRDLPRLAEEVLDPDAVIRWSVQGGTDRRGFSRMDLQVSGQVKLQCQRCLGAMEFGIDSAATIAVATDDESADRLDRDLADEAIEVVVGNSGFDLLSLVEDEALLTLPPAPRHQQCAGGTPSSEPEQVKESPFALLGKLKR